MIIVSMSGGKDSTATAILAQRDGRECRYLFADTGHEHAETYKYLDYHRDRLGIEIETVRADFSKQIERKRELVRTKWVDEGAVTASQAEEICELLQHTGVPMLDLCLWKGRFPSTRARFCSEELKHRPLNLRQMEIAAGRADVESWQGVRADESPSRARLPEREPSDHGITIFRPILHWTAAQVFDLHREAGIEPNPLYKQGMTRVGCMPCIHAGKSELREIAARFPAEIARVAEWERIVSAVTKRGSTTWFHASTDPTLSDAADISPESHGIERVAEWARTTRDGRQYDLLAATEGAPVCSSAYGLCE